MAQTKLEEKSGESVDGRKGPDCPIAARMKTCPYCQEPKALDSFNKDDKKKNGRSSLCRACQSLASRRHYERNKAAMKARARQHTARQSVVIRGIVNEAKSAPCTDCKLSYPPWVMEFDHLDGAIKRWNIADVVNKGPGAATVLAEIAKCEVVCANCHRQRTHERRTSARPT